MAPAGLAQGRRNAHDNSNDKTTTTAAAKPTPSTIQPKAKEEKTTATTKARPTTSSKVEPSTTTVTPKATTTLPTPISVQSTTKAESTTSTQSTSTTQITSSTTTSAKTTTTTKSSIATITTKTTASLTSTTVVPTTSTTLLSTVTPVPVSASLPSTTQSATVVSKAVNTHAATLAGIIIFGVFSFLFISCLVGFLLRRRADRKKLPPEYAKQKSYSPFRSASYSSSNVHLTSDTSYASSEANTLRPGTSSDDKSSMFSRARSGSTSSAIVDVPEYYFTSHEDLHRIVPSDATGGAVVEIRSNRFSFLPVRVARPNGEEEVLPRLPKLPDLTAESFTLRPSTSHSRPGSELPAALEVGRPPSFSSVSAHSGYVVSTWSPVSMPDIHSRPSTSGNRYYEPYSVARAV